MSGGMLGQMTDPYGKNFGRPVTSTGWFADCGGREDPAWMQAKWQPCLETGKGHIPSFDVWFDTKEACEAYIRDEIIPIAASLLD